jgi:hypothetical protein
MIPVIPWYVELISLATTLVIAVAVWRILASATSRSGLPPATQRATRVGLALFLGGWLGAALLLAPAPASLLARDRFYLSPLIPAFVLLPSTIALVTAWLSPTLRRVLSVVSLPAVIGVQVYRTIGLLFLILLGLGQLPAHFALPAGWGDIAVGVAAPLVAFALVRGIRGGRALAIGWNVFGLLDLVVAVGMGTGFLAPFLAPDLGQRVAPSAAMGVFPMILVPTFAVPVSVLLHLLALGRLQRDMPVASGLVPKAAS